MSAIKVELSSFVEDIAEEMIQAKKDELDALDPTDGKAVIHWSHKLAGTCGTYGLKELSKMARKLEEDAIEGKEYKKDLEEVSYYLRNLELVYVD